MDTITTPPPPAAGPEPLQGTIAVRQPQPRQLATQDDDRPVNGALLWLLVRRYLSYYVAFPSEAALNLVTAWIFHACARNRNATGMGQLIWNASPRLLILSRKAGAGKSTLLDLIVILTGSRRGKIPRITPARLAQITGQAYEVVCIDEGRQVLGAGGKQMDLQACLLAGYTPGASYEVSKTSLDLFGAVVLATKENLITEATKAVNGDDSSIGDLIKRSYSVILAEPDRPMPEVGQRARAEGAALARGLVKWTDDNRATLEQAAQDIADEDFAVATGRAERGEKPGKSLRAFQIGRALRAIGRGIDQQVTEDQQRKDIHGASPQCEATILAALSGNAGTASTGVMTELESLREAWEDRTEDDGDEFPEDEPGHIAYGDDSGPGEPDIFAAASPPARRAPAPPPATYTARWVIQHAPGEDARVEVLPGTYPSPEAAQEACEAFHRQACAQAGPGPWQPLTWARSASVPGTWGAVACLGDEAGPEVTYAVSAAGK